MNERVMQFRIGMFVIVAGLVLTMLIIWFGESPSLFRDHAYVKVRYAEAPGVAEGISVRKSGIRIGEVLSIELDDRPGQPDSVIVILSLEQKYKIKKDSVARITRSLIGDVAIDMLPGSSNEIIAMGKTPANAPELVGDITPDPSKALAAATAAFEKVGGTLKSIEDAANGFAVVAKKADHIDEFIDTIGTTGRNISAAAKRIDKVIADNEADIRPAITNLKDVSEKLGATFDAQTTARIRSITERLASVSTKLDAGMTDLQPVLNDLGTPAGKSNPTTNIGQAMAALNRIAANINLLTGALSDGRGHLNPNGSIQRLVTNPELFDNLSRAAASANDVFAMARPAIRYLAVFAEKISRDPSAMTKGALLRN